MLAVHTEDDDADDPPRATLTIASDVLAACHDVRDARPPAREAAMTWLYSLRAVARCARGGALGDRPLVLHGPVRPQFLVKDFFMKQGVPEARVILTHAAGEAICNDECDASELHVVVALGDSDDANGADRADLDHSSTSGPKNTTPPSTAIASNAPSSTR